MRSPTTTWLAGFFVLLLLAVALPVKAQPYGQYKLVIGMPFVYFDIEDIYHQRWISTYLRGRPVIILTGHRYQRYEILKWAESLKREFGLPGLVHLLWVVNTSKFPWSTSRTTLINQWRQFAPPIPLLLDWHGVIGKALRINYNVPNIIGIDAEGRFAFHEMLTYTPEVYAAVSQRVRALIAAGPAPMPGLPPQVLPPAGGTLPKGKRGLSE
ncbi:MAG: hypothetical protein OZSIB_1273 [Candidatus Ozemobacter sibiricus]|jgi:hypothetical protein|uniref:Thioredoxin domain-containing protein n=1 Tax=Candidatus Ozemobacter sibiricus TaxID=2268124 RepID=A0A367ZMH1_9BACT|nr:MAG: hypothetical protein OZSIB_1273 [Candidatus Ozemobacter sibiricus]